MWETIKNDPILKTVAIIILSVLGFGFAFNIMFGASTGGMEHSGGIGGGNFLGNTLSYIFILAFKLLLIALVIVALAAIFKFAKKHISNNEGGEIKMFDSIKKDPLLKGLTITGLLIISVWLISYLFSGMFGFGSGYNMMNGSAMMGNAGYGFGLSGLLALLLKILLFASVVGLIIGLVMYVKQSYGKEIKDTLSSVKVNSKTSVSCSNCSATVSEEFKFCPHCGGSVKEQCTSCGTELKKEWKCCPVCGTEKAVENHVVSE